MRHKVRRVLACGPGDGDFGPAIELCDPACTFTIEAASSSPELPYRIRPDGLVGTREGRRGADVLEEEQLAARLEQRLEVLKVRRWVWNRAQY